MEQSINEITAQLSAVAPRIGIGLVIFTAFWFSGFVLKKIICKIGRKKRRNKSIINLIGQTGKITLIVFGAVTGLGTMGVNVSALVAGLGLTGFALGFALKDILSNLLAGVLIIIYDTFKIDDRITVAGFEGTVKEIDIRYTTLINENKTILIPNSILFTNSVTILQTKE